MDNPRQRFATHLKLRLENEGLTIQSFAHRLADYLIAGKLRKKGSKEAAVAYVYAVLNCHRTVPIGAEEAWAAALNWTPGDGEYEEFITMIEAARAWGKSDGRAHLERLEAEAITLRAEKARAEKKIEEQGRAIAKYRAEVAELTRSLEDLRQLLG